MITKKQLKDDIITYDKLSIKMKRESKLSMLRLL